MASIDKTYIDGEDYLNYRNWYIENYDKMVKELGEPIWFYTFSIFAPKNWEEDYPEITPEFLKENTQDIKYWKNRYDFAIWNTSETKDKWLIKNCEIASFRETMLNTYSYKWKGFKDCNWIPKNKLKPKYINRK